MIFKKSDKTKIRFGLGFSIGSGLGSDFWLSDISEQNHMLLYKKFKYKSLNILNSIIQWRW